MSNKYIPLIDLVSDTRFTFDGVVYSNRNAKALYDKGLFNSLTTTSRIVSGKPNKNEKSYLFKTVDGDWILTTNRYWKEKRTVESYEGKRYDLLLILKNTC